MSTLIVGVDPGLTTGICALRFGPDLCRAGEPIAVQVSGSEGVVPLVQALIAKAVQADHVLAVEQFVVGARAARSGTAHAGRVTRALIVELGELAESFGAGLFTRSAAMVKPWATDARLDAAGLLDATRGMGHARDAARHALYAAVHMGVTADPFSKKAAAR